MNSVIPNIICNVKKNKNKIKINVSLSSSPSSSSFANVKSYGKGGGAEPGYLIT